METVQSDIAKRIEGHQKKGLYRPRALTDTSGQNISFMKNDYLALADNADLRRRHAQCFVTYASGSGGSPVNGGRCEAHVRLESRIAALTGCDAAVLFNSGYQANLAVMSLLGRLEIPVLLDKSIHASIYDGIQIGRVTYDRFRHNDVSHLCSKLKAHQIIMTEGMFSISGQIPPLADYQALAEEKQCGLFIDEAHSFGVFGQTGMGICEHFNLHQHQVPLRMISFAKAAGASGAVVIGQTQWIDALIQFARPYIYSTSMSPAFAQALNDTLDFVIAASEQRQQLCTLSRYFNEYAHASELPWRISHTPIKQLPLGCPGKAQQLKQYLSNKRVDVQLIRPPTVTHSESGIRVCLNAAHQLADIDQLFIHLQNMPQC